MQFLHMHSFDAHVTAAPILPCWSLLLLCALTCKLAASQRGNGLISLASSSWAPRQSPPPAPAAPLRPPLLLLWGPQAARRPPRPAQALRRLRAGARVGVGTGNVNNLMGERHEQSSYSCRSPGLAPPCHECCLLCSRCTPHTLYTSRLTCGVPRARLLAWRLLGQRLQLRLGLQRVEVGRERHPDAAQPAAAHRAGAGMRTRVFVGCSSQRGEAGRERQHVCSLPAAACHAMR